MKVLAKNKKAYFNYEVVDKLQAGIVLLGWEVKSARFGNVNLKDGFVRIYQNEAFLDQVNISRWKTQSMKEQIDTLRSRKLLLHMREIERLESTIEEKGMSAVPLQMYLADNKKIKVEIGIVRGKKKYDKRQKLKEKDMKRQIERDLKDYY